MRTIALQQLPIWLHLTIMLAASVTVYFKWCRVSCQVSRLPHTTCHSRLPDFGVQALPSCAP